MATPTIVENPDPAKTTKALQSQFKLNDKVMAAFKASTADTLTELRFMFANEEEAGSYVKAVSGLASEELNIMISRVRHMWHAIRQQATVREACKASISGADLDDMLDDKALVDAKSAFWKRHKLRFPPEIMPADSLVSRCSREMSKRMLMVFNVHSAKNLKYQVTTSRKRKHLAADLYTEQDEVVEDARDTREYLDKLMTYMLALAVAGINHTDKDQSQEAVLGADTTCYVQVPLDVAWNYVWRAKRAAATIPGNIRLAWLEKQDVEERTHWVAKFRDGADNLGTIIKEVMVTRDAHWSPVEAPRASTRDGHAERQPRSPNEPQRESKRKQDAPARASPQQQEIKLTLMNGDKLCPAFQKGRCRTQGKGCPAGLHKCGVVTSTNGRVCGKEDHGASKHSKADEMSKGAKGAKGKGRR